jgi:hypothetical protein
MTDSLKNKKIRDELFLYNDVMFTEDIFTDIRKLISYRLSNEELIELFIALEVTRRIGDTNLMQYYNNRILGILGLLVSKEG